MKRLLPFLFLLALNAWAGPNNAVTNLSVTNMATESYPPVVGQWTWPDHQIVSGSWAVHFEAFQGYAFNFKPLPYAYFTATDAHGHSKTNMATLVKDTTLTAAFPIGEYQATFNASDFTDHDTVTNLFYGFPWIGNTNYVSAPQYYVADTSGAFATYAVVSTTGNNSTGVVTNLAHLSAAESATFADAEHAASVGAKIILMKAGSYLRSPSVPPTSSLVATNTYSMVLPDSGVSRSQVIFTNRNNLDPMPSISWLVYSNVTFTQTTNYIMFDGNAGQTIWVDNCVLNGYGPITNIGNVGFYNGLDVKFTRCQIDNKGSIQTIGGSTFRGNLGTNFCTGGGAAFVGNRISFTNNFASDFTSIKDGSVYFNNGFYNAQGGVIVVSDPITSGVAIVQNVVEVSSNGNQPSMAIGALATGDERNIIIARNSLIGDRANMVYYNTGNTPNWFHQIRMMDNLLDGIACKSDIFINNSNQVGNWEFVNQVGCPNNLIGYTAGNSFLNEFIGVNSRFLGFNDPPGAEMFNYVNNQSQWGGTNGNGDYHIKSSSVALNGFCSWFALLWDIEGNNRGDIDPPGAFSTANPRRGGLMICN